MAIITRTVIRQEDISINYIDIQYLCKLSNGDFYILLWSKEYYILTVDEVAALMQSFVNEGYSVDCWFPGYTKRVLELQNHIKSYIFNI